MDVRIIVIAVDRSTGPAVGREAIAIGIRASGRGEIAVLMIVKRRTRGRETEARRRRCNPVGRVERQQRVEPRRRAEQTSGTLEVDGEPGLGAQSAGAERYDDSVGQIELIEVLRRVRPQVPVAVTVGPPRLPSCKLAIAV